MKIPTLHMPRILTALACATFLAGSMTAADAAGDDKKKPKVQVRATPQAGFSPLRVVLSAELKGGDNDHPDYYCPTVEWVWGDDTRAESSEDCEPYEAGKSEIKRRYTVTRVFNTFGEYKVEFRVRQKDKVVASGSTTVRVQPGLRDGGGE